MSKEGRPSEKDYLQKRSPMDAWNSASYIGSSNDKRPRLKEILAAAPLEGINLSRPTDLDRDIDL